MIIFCVCATLALLIAFAAVKSELSSSRSSYYALLHEVRTLNYKILFEKRKIEEEKLTPTKPILKTKGKVKRSQTRSYGVTQ